jgi:hypothetical protein
MERGVSPVIATTTLIAITVVTIVTTWYWVAAYTTAPALAQSSFKAYTITNIYKNASKTGCGAIDIKNIGGTQIKNVTFYVRDYRTGKPAGSNGTDPVYPASVQITSLAPGTTAPFSISIEGSISFTKTNILYCNGCTAYEVAIGDIDNDSLNELASTGGSHLVKLDYSGGSWARSDIASSYPTPGYTFGLAYAVAIGDVNNDSRDDVVVSDTDKGNISVYENRSGGWFSTNVTISPPSDYVMVEDVTVGDADNDGKDEIVIGLLAGTSDYPNQTRMYKNTSGGWRETNISNIYLNGGNVYSVEAVAIGDANNDGQNEVVIGFQYWGGDLSNETRMYKNTSGKWVETNISSTNADIWAIEIGDADNDGLNEVVVGSDPYSDNKSLRMYKNTSGGWRETNITEINEAALSVAIGDANNDGRNEIVVGFTYGAYEIRMYENKTGTWVETNISDDPYSTDVWGVTVGDGNNDGSNEVYAAMEYSSDYQVKSFTAAATATYVPSGVYILRTNTPGFTDQVFTCA